MLNAVRTSRPLVIIGLDSGDPEFILAGIRDRSLKTLASILDQGTHGTLKGPEMISVHGVWLTFFSGVSLSDHSFYHPVRLESGTYRVKRMDVHDISPFWADSTRLQTLIVDIPDIPMIPGLSGFQLANWGSHNTRTNPSSIPQELIAELQQVIGAPIRSDEHQGRRGRDVRILKQLLNRVELKGKLCRHLLNQMRCDLAVVMFADSHAASHRFRKYLQTTDELKNAINISYQSIDREIGLLLQSFPETPNVFVVSNCGIRDGYPLGKQMNLFLHSLGYQTLLRPATLYHRFLPENWRLGWDEYIPSHWRARWQLKRFGAGIDWSKTTAFALPAYYTGYIRVNLKGREPGGIVAPGSEYDSLLDRIEADFQQLVDEETNEPVVQTVHRTASLFGEGPPAHLPDLIVDWRPCNRLSRRLVHPRITIVQKKHGIPRGNFHSSTGLILASGPDIAKNSIPGEFSPVDFADLFRSLMKSEGLQRVNVNQTIASFLS